MQRAPRAAAAASRLPARWLVSAATPRRLASVTQPGGGSSTLAVVWCLRGRAATRLVYPRRFSRAMLPATLLASLGGCDTRGGPRAPSALLGVLLQVQQVHPGLLALPLPHHPHHVVRGAWEVAGRAASWCGSWVAAARKGIAFANPTAPACPVVLTVALPQCSRWAALNKRPGNGVWNETGSGGRHATTLVNMTAVSTYTSRNLAHATSQPSPSLQPPTLLFR